MKVRILGGSGGIVKGLDATSYLVDEHLLIDAGACASPLTVSEQTEINWILISHSHLDHIKDLAFICDNCFGLKKEPFEVYTNETVKDAIKSHLMNDIIWPDFSVLPTPETGIIRFNTVSAKEEFEVGPYKILPIHVNHPGNAIGFIVSKGDKSLLFTQDTGPTDEIWEYAHKYKKNLKGIFTEVSFPNSLDNIAKLSQHHTPHSLALETKKMPTGIPIFIGHLKPSYRVVLEEELHELSDDDFEYSIIGDKDETFHF